MSLFLPLRIDHVLFASGNKTHTLGKMEKKKKDIASQEDPNKKLQQIIDDKKNETSALKKILKSLNKNVKHKTKKDD